MPVTGTTSTPGILGESRCCSQVNDYMLTWLRNDLVKAVATVNKNTIVVVHSVGPIILESILSNPNVQAIVWAG